MQDLVWLTVIDHRFMAAVVRTGTYTGELAVSDGLETVYRQPVQLMYNALLGPSSEETSYWRQCAEEYIERNSSRTPSSNS